jgi:amino acid transporter
MAKEEDKNIPGLAPALPTYSQSQGTILPEDAARRESKTWEGAVREEDWATRNGLNLRSFGKRDYGRGIVELERSMKPRHLHMIAIGGSIGAGFFVGSGSALSNGGPGSLFIDFLIIGIMMFNVVYVPLYDYPGS